MTEAAVADTRGRQQVRVGTVVSAKMDKTVVVRVERLVQDFPRSGVQSSKAMSKPVKLEEDLGES